MYVKQTSVEPVKEKEDTRKAAFDSGGADGDNTDVSVIVLLIFLLIGFQKILTLCFWHLFRLS